MKISEKFIPFELSPIFDAIVSIVERRQALLWNNNNKTATEKPCLVASIVDAQIGRDVSLKRVN